LSNRIEFHGQVVDTQGAAVGGARVWAGLIPFAEPIDLRADAQGKFTIELPETNFPHTTIIASDQTRIGIGFAPTAEETPQPAELRITLGEAKLLKVSLTGANSQPVADARAGLLVKYLQPLGPVQTDAEADLSQSYSEEEIELPPVQTDAGGNATLLMPTDADSGMVYAYKPGQGFDYQCLKSRGPEKSRHWPTDSRLALQLGATRKVTIRTREPDGKPIAGLHLYLSLLEKSGEPDFFNFSFTPAMYRAVTDAAGVAHFDDLPAWDGELIFWPDGFKFTHQRITWDPAKKPKGNVKVTLKRLVPVSGKAELPDGRPASGIKLRVNGADGSLDDFDNETTTDEAGNFKVAVAPDHLCLLAVDDDKWGATAIDGLVVQRATPVTGLNFKLRPATRITGRVVVGPERRPVAGQNIMLLQYGRGLRGRHGFSFRQWIQRPTVSFGPSIQRDAFSDSEGRYEFHVGPGTYDLHGPSRDNVSRGMGPFEVVDQTEVTFDLAVPQPE